ncbi:MAG: hypothetical protein AABY64_10725 [Bdellovibrionota bacterium]
MGILKLIPVVYLLATINAFAQDNSQQPLSELALFNRCYAHLTQKALPLKHALKNQIKSGSMTALNACMQILDSARLIESGGNEGKLISDTSESRDVLLSLNDFHRTWFTNDHIVKAISYLEDFNGQPYVHDEAEAGLHVTRVLLTNSAKFSEIVTGNSAMEALRTNGPSLYDQNAPELPINKKMVTWSSNESTAVRVPLNPPLVQTGELVGIRKLSLNPTKQNFVSTARNGTEVGGKYFKTPGSIRMNQAFGGGIIGTQSYLLLNLGRPNEKASDGGLVMNRRWSKTVLSDLLCRDLPAVRLSDATPLVQTFETAQTPPFRKAGSCMSCHSTMDPLAAVIRNLSYTAVYYPLLMGTVHIRAWPTTQPAESGPVDLDSNYFQRPTRGALFYRSYDGSLKNDAVNSLPELGQAMANNNDLYICTAAKYFRHFTGVKVNLQDEGDPSNARLPASDKAYRDLVINLGLELKKTQSLRTLIQSILSSNVYRKSSMRLPEKQ